MEEYGLATGMADALDYLEECLEEKADIEEAARRANCSTFHFYRVFEMVTGVGPGEYLRRRRLSEAALALVSGETKVIDLALRYGWESPDAFSRAFRREFGCLPSEAKKPGTRLHLFPRLSFSVVLKGDTPMEYRIEPLPEILLTGISRRIDTHDGKSFRDVPAFWGEIMGDGRWRQLEARADFGRMGVCGICRDFDMHSGEFSYSIAIDRTADHRDLPVGTADFSVPASTWARFTSRGPIHPNIQDTTKRIFAEWLPASEWEHAGTAEVEWYGPGDPDSQDYVCEVWIPIKRKSSI